MPKRPTQAAPYRNRPMTHDEATNAIIDAGREATAAFGGMRIKIQAAGDGWDAVVPVEILELIGHQARTIRMQDAALAASFGERLPGPAPKAPKKSKAEGRTA